MTIGHTRIETKGKCIYCGRTDVRLTDEHILPFFIGGVHVLCEASCDECAEITSKFERDVAQGMWGDARNSYNAPSRRKKKRKKYIFLNDQFNPGKKLKIPFSEYPPPMIFYTMNTAGLLNGLPSSFDSSDSWLLSSIVDETKVQAFEKKYPGQLTAKFTNSPGSFARLLAKIGYGNVLCSLDPGDFNPICLPYILGQKSNLSYIVGSRTDIPKPINKNGYFVATHVYGNSTQLLIMAEIRLVANNHTPIYHVVVGSVDGKEAVDFVLNKIEATCSAIISDGIKGTQTPENEYHWWPRVWPLPHLRK